MKLIRFSPFDKKKNTSKIYKNNNIPNSNPFKLTYNFRLLYDKIHKTNEKKMKRVFSQGQIKSNHTSIPFKNSLSSSPLESGFKPLINTSNIYTQQYDFIQNTKMALYNKYEYENGKYETDRLGFFNMKTIHRMKPSNTTLYKNSTLLNKRNKEKKLLEKKLSQYINKHNNRNHTIKNKQSEIDNNNNSKYHYRSGPLYKELTAKKNEMLSLLITRDYSCFNCRQRKKNLNYSSSYNNINNNNNNNNNNERVMLFDKTHIDSIPITSPVSMVSIYNHYSTSSEKRRYEKLMDSLLKLKYIISLNTEKGKESEYIIQFLLKKNIDKFLINELSIQNFLKFINSNMYIDPHLSAKENISNILIGNIKIGNNNEEDKKEFFISQQENKTKEKNLILKKLNRKKYINSAAYEKMSLEKQRNYLNKKIIDDEEDKLKNRLEKEINVIKKEIEICKLKDDIPTQIEFKYLKRKEIQEKKDEIDLRLGNCEKEERNNYISEIVKKENHIAKKKISDLNERLYYSTVEKDKDVDIDTYRKKLKLTELIMLQKINSKKKIRELSNNVLNEKKKSFSN